MISGNMTLSKVGAYGQNQQGFIKNLKGVTAIKKNPLCSASLFTPKEPQKYTVESLGGKDPETLFIQTKEAKKYLKVRPDDTLNRMNTEKMSLEQEMNDNLLRAITNKYAQFKSQYLTEGEATENLGKFLSSLARGGFGADRVGRVDRVVDGLFSALGGAPSASDIESIMGRARSELGLDERVRLSMPIDFGDGGGLEGIVGGDDEAPLRAAGLIPDSRSAMGARAGGLPVGGDEEALQDARARAQDEEEEEEGGAEAEAVRGGAVPAGAGFIMTPSAMGERGVREIEIKRGGVRIGTISASTLRKIASGQDLTQRQRGALERLGRAGITGEDLLAKARELGYNV